MLRDLLRFWWSPDCVNAARVVDHATWRLRGQFLVNARNVLSDKIKLNQAEGLRPSGTPIMMGSAEEKLKIGRYRRKVFLRAVDAFQMTKERQLSKTEWPEWLHAAWNGRVEMIDSMFSHPDGAKVGEMPDFFVNTQKGLRHVEHGDWIVRDENWHLVHCEEFIFEAAYEPVEVANEA